jgi:diadenosine tetraphosphatase ApaH/serine/threonine PP2A family protein phosphatase
MTHSDPAIEPCLKRCNLSQCEAICCSNGVYLDGKDIGRITDAIAKHPDFFEYLPDDFLIEGSFEGLASGLKTATKPYQYTRPIPAHFRSTRCVFCLDDHRCSLQVAAEKSGQHPWTYKPTACWLFPLSRKKSDPVRPPPRSPEEDPTHKEGDDFPGFTVSCDCGNPQPDGQPWPEVLKEEIAWCQKQGWSIHAPPHTVNGHEKKLG